jgi:hypothetical protein
MPYPDSISPEELRIRMDNQDDTREEKLTRHGWSTGV